jgi:surface antigen
MRCKHLLQSLGIAIVALLVPSLALAFNTLFTGRGPMSHLTQADIDIARAEIRSALETGADGDTHTWANPQTKASGTVTPTKTYMMKGMRCRLVDFSTYAGGQRNASTWTLCKTKDGWKVVT